MKQAQRLLSLRRTQINSAAQAIPQDVRAELLSTDVEETWLRSILRSCGFRFTAGVSPLLGLCLPGSRSSPSNMFEKRGRSSRSEAKPSNTPNVTRINLQQDFVDIGDADVEEDFGNISAQFAAKDYSNIGREMTYKESVSLAASQLVYDSALNVPEVLQWIAVHWSQQNRTMQGIHLITTGWSKRHAGMHALQGHHELGENRCQLNCTISASGERGISSAPWGYSEMICALSARFCCSFLLLLELSWRPS